MGVRQPVFDPNDMGRLRMWKLPERGKEYVIGADPSEGKAGGDFASAQVFDKTSWEQVAVLHGKYEADVFAKELYKLGVFYNEALLVPERNSMGVAVIITLRDLFYPNMYIKEQLKGDIDNNVTPELGWQTNMKTKAQLIANAQEAVRNGLVTIHDEETMQELFSYSYNDQGQAGAAGNGHDDRVMAFMIGLKISKDAPSVRRDNNFGLTGASQFGVNDLTGGTESNMENEYF
jgi:hypothetical protein